MYTRILVPLDGSTVAEQVLPYVRLLARGLETRVELLRIFEPVSASLVDPAHGLYLDRIIASVRSHVDDYLEGVAESLRKDGLTVSFMAHEGNPAATIVKEAEAEPGTLVVLCTHGRSGVTRWFLGSTTDKVLHASSRPFLIVRSRERQVFESEVELKTILVPLDGSTLAEQVLPHATLLAKTLGLKVTLVRVTPSAKDYALRFVEFAGYQFAYVQDLVKRADAEARSYLDGICEKLHQQGLPSVEGRVVHGTPPDTIIDMAREIDDCLIAMGTHGSSGIDRWIRGSVTDRVLRHSADPVLIVRVEKEPFHDAHV